MPSPVFIAWILDAFVLYSFVFLLHSLRTKLSLAPVFIMVGFVASVMMWIGGNGARVEFAGLTVYWGSTLYAGLVLSAMLIYALDGAAAARSVTLSYRILHADGRIRWVGVKGQPALGPDGEVLHIDGVGSDVTERRVAELALQMSEQRYDLAMEAAADGLYDWNVSKGEVFLNPRWFLMLGYEPHEFPHVIDTWKLLVHPEDLDRAVSEQREQMALKGGLLSSSGCARRAASTDGYSPVERSPNATRMALPCPDGIAGSNIPLCARIMAVSDVYDTLTSRRC